MAAIDPDEPVTAEAPSASSTAVIDPETPVSSAPDTTAISPDEVITPEHPYVTAIRNNADLSADQKDARAKAFEDAYQKFDPAKDISAGQRFGIHFKQGVSDTLPGLMYQGFAHPPAKEYQQLPVPVRAAQSQLERLQQEQLRRSGGTPTAYDASLGAVPDADLNNAVTAAQARLKVLAKPDQLQAISDERDRQAVLTAANAGEEASYNERLQPAVGLGQKVSAGAGELTGGLLDPTNYLPLGEASEGAGLLRRAVESGGKLAVQQAVLEPVRQGIAAAANRPDQTGLAAAGQRIAGAAVTGAGIHLGGEALSHLASAIKGLKIEDMAGMAPPEAAEEISRQTGMPADEAQAHVDAATAGPPAEASIDPNEPVSAAPPEAPAPEAEASTETKTSPTPATSEIAPEEPVSSTPPEEIPAAGQSRQEQIDPEEPVQAAPPAPAEAPPVSDIPVSDTPAAAPEAVPVPEQAPEPPAAVPEAQPTPEPAPQAPARLPLDTSRLPISIKNATVDREITNMGLPLPTHGERVSFEEDRAAAAAATQADPFVGQKLVDNLQKNMRPATHVENAILTQEMTRIANERDAARAAADLAAKSGDAVAMAEAQNRVESAKAAFFRAAEVADKTGTDQSLSLGSRRMLMNRDYSLATMEYEARVAGGNKPLNEVESAAVQQLYDKIRKTREAADAATAAKDQRIADLEASNQILRMVRENASQPKKPPAPRALAKFISDHADAARARIKARAASLNSGIDPTYLGDLAIVGADYISKGIAKSWDTATWAAAMIKEFGEEIRPHLTDIYAKAQEAREVLAAHAATGRDTLAERESTVAGMKARIAGGQDVRDLGRYSQKLAEQFIREGIHGRDNVIDAVHGVLKDLDPTVTRSEARDAISGYGDFKPQSQDAVKRELADLKGQMQQLGKLEDMDAGRVPQKTGVQRRIPSAEERALIKQVNEQSRKGGFNVTDPETQLKSALDGLKTRWRNEIDDLEFQIATGKKTIAEKTATPLDAEAKELQGRLKQRRQDFQDTFGKTEITPEQRVKNAIAAVQRSTEEYDRRIKENDLFPQKAASKTPETPELRAARAQRDAAKETLKHLQDSDQANIAEKAQGALDRQKAALEKQIADRSEALREGAYDTKAGSPANRPAQPEIETLKQQLEAVNKQIKDARKAANPPKTREEIAAQARKTFLKNRIADRETRMAQGNFDSRVPPPVRQLDPTTEALEAAAKAAEDDYQKALLRRKLSGRSNLEKTQAALVQWRRGFLLSGVTTLGKLSAAALERVGITPLEEVAGSVLGHLPIIRDVAARAPREGGFSVSAEVQALTEGFTKGMQDAADTLRTGKSEIDRLYSRQGKVKESDVIEPAAIEFFGRLHGALKSPVKRAEFARSFAKRMQFAVNHGADQTNPLVQTKVALAAYKDAKRSVFLQDNRAVDMFNGVISQALKPDKITGKPTVRGLAVAAFLKSALPIVRVPTNLVAEALQYTVGTAIGSGKIARALKNGVSNLPEEAADSIMRNLKKGSLGLAALTFGYFNPEMFGGFYQPGQKRDPSDVKAGTIRLGGLDIPGYVLHHPLLAPFQIGSTIRRVADAYLNAPDGDKSGFWANVAAKSLGIYRSGIGLIEETPFGRVVTDEAKLMAPSTAAEGVGETLKSFVPAIVNNVAEATDRGPEGLIKRKPTSVLQNVETAIPGLRQTVPEQVPLSSAEKNTRYAASKFKADLGIPPPPGSDVYPYDDLSSALRAGDYEKASDALQALVEQKAREQPPGLSESAKVSRARAQIVAYYDRQATEYFTGNAQREFAFRRTLDDQGQTDYAQAKADRRQAAQSIRRLVYGH